MDELRALFEMRQGAEESETYEFVAWLDLYHGLRMKALFARIDAEKAK